MLPPRTAVILRDEHGLRAQHVTELGMAHTEDAVIAQFAREHSRVVVTENVADFAGERGVVLVFVLDETSRRAAPWPQDSPTGSPGGQLPTPDPFPGQHWLR